VFVWLFICVYVFCMAMCVVAVVVVACGGCTRSSCCSTGFVLYLLISLLLLIS
jgi:hypothetical protein